MNSERATSVLLRGRLESIKEVQELLRQRGIASEIRRPDEKGCGTG
jgi:hypothetical protein